MAIFGQIAIPAPIAAEAIGAAGAAAGAAGATGTSSEEMPYVDTKDVIRTLNDYNPVTWVMDGHGLGGPVSLYYNTLKPMYEAYKLQKRMEKDRKMEEAAQALRAAANPELYNYNYIIPDLSNLPPMSYEALLNPNFINYESLPAPFLNVGPLTARPYTVKVEDGNGNFLDHTLLEDLNVYGYPVTQAISALPGKSESLPVPGIVTRGSNNGLTFPKTVEQKGGTYTPTGDIVIGGTKTDPKDLPYIEDGEYEVIPEGELVEGTIGEVYKRELENRERAKAIVEELAKQLLEEAQKAAAEGDLAKALSVEELVAALQKRINELEAQNKNSNTNSENQEPELKPDEKQSWWKRQVERAKNILKLNKNNTNQGLSTTPLPKEPLLGGRDSNWRYLWRTKSNSPDWTPAGRRLYNTMIPIGIPTMMTAGIGSAYGGDGFFNSLGLGVNKGFGYTRDRFGAFFRGVSGNDSVPNQQLLQQQLQQLLQSNDSIIGRYADGSEDSLLQLIDSINNQGAKGVQINEVSNANPNEILPHETNTNRK